ncbi:MAG: CocE/NonD family hydrolase [Thermomicrobiales bacterium]|nr:CocE/NonD family hydrolase [Thermomicrobiales bacterium]
MPARYSVSFERNVPVPMSDGTILYADVYRPAGPGKYPVILQRTPYDKSAPINSSGPFALRAAGEGYAVVIQDTRGRWASEGVFHAFPYERQDGYDTCAWLQEQPWSNGRIGMCGGSYVGLTQWQAALGNAPGLQAIVPTVTAADYHEGWTYQGGAFELNFNLSWTLTYLSSATAAKRLAADPGFSAKVENLFDRIDNMTPEFDRMPLKGDPLLAELAPYYDEWLSHPSHGAFWDKIKVDTHYNDIDVAALNVGAWYDIFLGGTIHNFLGMQQHGKTEQARKGSSLLIGPWEHMTVVTVSPVGEYDPGVRSWHTVYDVDGVTLRWYDKWLRDVESSADEKPVTIFVMGANQWRQEDEWPLARTRYVDYFFASDGKANTLFGDGKLSREPDGDGRPDNYLYDPLNPAPTRGGPLCCNTYWAAAGAFDQTETETRPDVLVYSSPILEEPVEVTGPVKVILYAASSAVDTDFTAKLVDVSPCGDAKNLTDGIIRARYRKTTREEHFLIPGEVEAYEIDLWATSNVFLPGHQIRVEISSSNFPRFDRNPNHGGVIAEATKEDCIVAHQTVYHDAGYPSRIVLPVVEGDLP